MVKLKSFFFIFSISFLFSLTDAGAQKAPDCIKVASTKRPTVILIDNGQLTKFYKNFTGEATFGDMKMVKSEQAYYLLATEQNGPRIFAFELEEKGKKLFLNNKLPVQSCDQGSLGLDTFLQDDDRAKIIGCRLGNHTIQQKQ